MFAGRVTSAMRAIKKWKIELLQEKAKSNSLVNMISSRMFLTIEQRPSLPTSDHAQWGVYVL